MIENFKKKVLSNGMTVVFEKRDLPIVSVIFAVKQGGVNESLEEKGISHYIEHMLYKGTPTRSSQQIAEEIERRGGELNGFTSEELTGYFCKMPSKHLNVALEVLGDMIKNPLFDEKELEKERKVIFEEIKMCHDNPLKHVFDEIQKALYDGVMDINLAGTIETMNSINRKKIVEKFKEAYVPENMILCVVGDADFDGLCDFVEKNFEMKKGKIFKQKFNLTNETNIEERKGIDQANLVFAHHIPLSKDEKSHSAQVLSCLMAEGMSSRLFAEIREKRNLAYAVKGEANINRDFSYSLIYVGTTKENVEKVKGLILEEFRKVAESLGEKELSEVKEQMIGNYHISMEDSQDQMISLLASEVHGEAEDFYKFEENIRNVKLEDVKKLASEVKEGNYSFFALVPEE